jgi:hypothetical protein
MGDTLGSGLFTHSLSLSGILICKAAANKYNKAAEKRQHNNKHKNVFVHKCVTFFHIFPGPSQEREKKFGKNVVCAYGTSKSGAERRKALGEEREEIKIILCLCIFLFSSSSSSLHGSHNKKIMYTHTRSLAWCERFVCVFLGYTHAREKLFTKT